MRQVGKTGFLAAVTAALVSIGVAGCGGGGGKSGSPSLVPGPGTGGPGASALPIQTIARLGDPVGNSLIKSGGGYFGIGALNDSDQLLFSTANAAGGQLLLQYAGGRIIPIVSGGAAAPGGVWSQKVGIRSPISMNQQGNAVFAADVSIGSQRSIGLFRWDYQRQQVLPIALQGQPVLRDLIVDTSPGVVLSLNNQDEVAMALPVRPAGGQDAAQGGVFFLGQNDQLVRLAVPGQELPDGGTAAWAWQPSVNDAGTVAFLARADGDSVTRAYLWQRVTNTPLPITGLNAPPGKHLYGFTGAWVNNRNSSVLLSVHLHSLAGIFYSLYRYTDGQIVPVAVPDQEMPGGGQFQSLLDGGVSAPNDAGQHAFLARLQDGTTAAYRLDADGRISLILKSGTATSLGQVVSVGAGSGASQGIGLNSRGQVAFTVRITGQPEMIVLLSP
jgi:hypothetical protein